MQDRPAPRNRRHRIVVFVGALGLTLLLLLEVVLQCVGYPYAPDARLRPHFIINGDERIQTDPFLDNLEGGAWRQELPLRKAPDVFRVAMLGGSSIEQLGDADLLKKRLIESKIAPQVEVLNFGVCGCGTDRALVSVKQALTFDVDVLLLYTGHNEFISESNYKTYRQPTWLRRNSRLVQLCTGNPWQPEPGRLYTEAEKEAIYAQFSENLRAMCRMAREAGVPLIMGAVAMNLKAPLVPYTRGLYDLSKLPAEPNQVFFKGLEQLRQGRYDNAKKLLQQAIADCPRPWRATWRINLILRETAEELDMPLADVEHRINALARHGIPGQDIFHDYCHLHSWSDPIVMETFADVVVREFSSRVSQASSI